ncbi:MAG TPA: hypothetical protein VF171_00110, partial [Trueperaceae bacterium]
MRNLHLSGALLLALLAGCLPVPDLRLGLRLPPTHYRLAPSAVQSAYVSLPGMPEPHTPPRYNRALYLRYFDPSQPRNIVLVLVPGIFGGATSLDILARQLVASTPGLEVWAVDRRANLLEEHAAAIRS